MNFSSAVSEPKALTGHQLTAAQARRIALAAQGFGRARPDEASRAKSRQGRQAPWPHPDRLGQRARPCAPHAGLFAAGGLSAGVAGAGGPASQAVRILGPRGFPDPLRNPATAALAHGAGERGEGIYKGLARFGMEHADAIKALFARTGKARSQQPRATWAAKAAAAPGGAGATRSDRSNGCSGRA